MKNKIKLLSVCAAVIISLASAQKASAIGIAVGGEKNLKDNIISNSAPDHIFIGGDIFSNYYNRAAIKYTYGAKVTLGYKYSDMQVFGLAGYQNAQFNSSVSGEFKEKGSPIYGFGIGYNIPQTNLGIRLNQTFFQVDRYNDSRENFSFTDVMLVLVF